MIMKINPLKRNHWLAVLFFCIVSFVSFSQNCDCESEFISVKSFIEENYAGFNDKVSNVNRNTYSKLENDLLQQAKSASSDNYCYFTIQTLLNYFNDGHLRLIVNPKKTNNSATETISLSSETIAELHAKSATDIEGIYTTISKSYEIALIKNQTPFRDYVGVITATNTKEWEVGQVKLELKHIEGDNYNGIYYLKDHTPEVKSYILKSGQYRIDNFIKNGTTTLINVEETEPFFKNENSTKVVFYEDVNDSTAYLRIKSFDQRFFKKVISVVKKNEKKIKSKPYLIIDVRYNGGGSDFVYEPLLPFIYTNPIKSIGVDVLSTPENILSWQRVIDENPKLPENVKNRLQYVISQMKENPNQLVNIVNDTTETMQEIYEYPKKIAVLIDKDCASSTEEFLLTAKQSQKVVLMGEPTAGVLDYSNMRIKNLECSPFILGYSTTRSRRIPENAIDETGITPNYTIDFDKRWIDNVLKTITK